MKRFPAFLSFSVAIVQLIFCGLACAQSNALPAKATIRSVHGNVEYSTGDKWLSLKTEQKLDSGACIRTSTDSDCYLQVNGLTSTIKILEETTLILQKMTTTGAGASADTQTVLDLKTGEILGSVRKLAAGSIYEIHTTNGTAHIRGGDFAIQVVSPPTGGFVVTFTCVTGQVICSATEGGKPVTIPLDTGQSWTSSEPNTATGKPTEVMTPKQPTLAPKELRSVQQMAERYNSFGFQLLDATRKSRPKENIFISPFGVGVSLSILQSGAQGPTRREITRVLDMGSLAPAEIGSANKVLLGQLSSLDNNVQLEIANSLWADHVFSLNTDFVAQARDFYDAEVAPLDFDNPASVGEVNSWASRHTHGTIPAILSSLGNLAPLVVLDAVYFKGRWAYEFKKRDTTNKPFKLADGSKLSHPRMSQSGMFDYYETRSFQLISLPYRGGATMESCSPKAASTAFSKA